MNPLFLIDFYKFGHVDQYPKDIRKVYVNFTPRSSRVEGEKGVIFFGLQRFLRKILVEQFDNHFFHRNWADVEREYREVIFNTLGIREPRLNHIRELWDYQRLPLDIFAVPEGTYVPLGVPAMVIVNNKDWAFWLPNYIETMMSNNLWHACTSATTAHRYRRLFIKHALAAGEDNLSFIDWQGHDFSYRGLSGFDSAVLSGMGHLLSFSGTDTLPAILEAKKYYGASLSCGGSVPATEHSVMCAGTKDSEQETFRHLIEDVYPAGIVSIVSDTWDLWKVLTEIVPNLRDKILARDGKVVIRPDSGDPVEILTGTRYNELIEFNEPTTNPKEWGALRLLARALGVTPGPGGWTINKGGLIYGDSITVERADHILGRARQQGYSPYNFVFGIGSYTYQYVTRDTYNFAFKATAVEREVAYSGMTLENGTTLPGPIATRKIEAIYKDPITDNANKKSHRGIPVAMRNEFGELHTYETLNPKMLTDGGSMFRQVFNGSIMVIDNFETIRSRVRSRDRVED